MTLRFDQREALIRDVQARAAMNRAVSLRRRRRRRRPPRQTIPRGAELRYRRALSGILRQVRELLNAEVLPALEQTGFLVRQQRPDGRRVRVDGPIDVIRGLFARLRELLFGPRGAANEDEANSVAESAANDTNRHNRQTNQRVFESTLNAPLPTVEPAVPDITAAFVAENVRRIQGLVQTHVDRVEATVLRGFRRGLTNREIGQDITRETGIAARKAHLLARDQIASLNSELTQVRQRSMGVEAYIWRSSQDERVRETHRDFDGQRFTWATGSPEGHPGEPINCRCVAEPILDPLFTAL